MFGSEENLFCDHCDSIKKLEFLNAKPTDIGQMTDLYFQLYIIIAVDIIYNCNKYYIFVIIYCINCNFIYNIKL